MHIFVSKKILNQGKIVCMWLTRALDLSCLYACFVAYIRRRKIEMKSERYNDLFVNSILTKIWRKNPIFD